MKKNHVNILLIVAVVALWGIVIYRFVSNSSGSNEAAQQSSVLPKHLPAKKAAGTFQLSGNYRDPFLGNLSKPANTEKKKNNTPAINKLKKEEPPVQQKWPEIKYIGLVKNNASGKMVALVNVGGKEMRLDPGQEYNGIRMDKMYKDSCLVSMNKNYRTIKK